ncbi:MAG TPA: beta-propeller fold lactonase family protein [Nannocystaceae bacterium]|nr:beta-propeller fold lactonase family protein [Nannocystaceae bacterium]
MRHDSLRFHLLLATTLAACGDDGVPVDDDSSGSTANDASTSDAETTGDPTVTPGSSSTDAADTTGTAEGSSTTAPATESTGDATTDTTGDDTTGAAESTDTGDETTGGSSSGESSTGESNSEESSSEESSSSATTGSVGGTCDGACVYVGASITNAAVVFDLADGDSVSTIDLTPEASYPYDATIAPSGTETWFVGASGDGVVVLDTATNVAADQFTPSAADGYLVDVLFGQDGDVAYLASRDNMALYTFDAASHAEIDTLPTPNSRDAGKMALDPCTGFVHVVEWYGDWLMTYDPGADTWSSVDVDATVPGTSLWDLRVAPDGSALYVVDRGNDQLHVWDLVADGGVPTTPVASVDVCDDPWGIDITSDGATVVVACEDSSEVWFVNTATLATAALALAADSDPRDVDITADDAFALVPTGDVAGDDGIYVIDLATQAVVQTLTDASASNSNVVAVTPQSVACGA